MKDLLPPFIETVAGIDLAYSGNLAVAAAVLLDYQTLQVLEKKVAVTKVMFPYVPTLLSFRELKAAFLAYKHLSQTPDVILVDAHGYSHPFRLGFASHFGVVVKKPTIGVAKKLLCGEIGPWKNNWAPIVAEGEVIGAALRTRKGIKPIYISVGNMVTLNTAIKIVLHTTRRYRIPEPVRQAHMECTRIARLLRSL